MHHFHHHQHRHPTERSLRASHMEHPSKRRRVERRSIDESVETSSSGRIQQESQMLVSGKESSRGGLPKVVLPSSGDKVLDILVSSLPEAEPPLEPLDRPRLSDSKLELRQVLPPVTSVANGAVNTVENIASGLVQSTAGSTNPNTAAATVPSPTNPGTVQPPAAIAAQEARNSALAAEQAQAKEDNRLPPPPGSPASPPGAPSTAASQRPTSIQLQASGSNSQQVLSNPPTPLPASPAASINLSASSSYFTSSPASLVLSATLPSKSIGISTLSNNNSTLSSTSTITSSVTNTITSSTTSTDIAILAAMSSSQASMEAKTKSVTQPPNSGSLTESQESQTTMITIASSFGPGQSSASGNNGVGTGAGTGGIGGASKTAGGATSTSTAGSGSGGGTNTPATPALIGGIVGGLSGLVLILLAALLLLRWKKGRLGSGERRTISPPMLQTSAPGVPPQSGTGTSGTQRSSTTPIAAAGIFGRFRPSSSQTATTSDTAPSERGFQKISGRKLPSVLTSGGDGYGEAGAAGVAGGTGAVATSKGASSVPQQRGVAPGQGPFAGLTPGLRPSTAHSLSGSSFYRDSKGFYGGVVPESTSGSGATEPSGSPTSLSPTFPSPLAVAGGAKDPGNPSRKPTMRPGPARTPVMHEAGAVPPPRPPRGTPPPPLGSQNPRDLLGRSHPSEDGSRASRFRESTTPP